VTNIQTNLSDDDEVKKVRFFPIQEVQAATKPPLCLVSRKIPGANQTPLTLNLTFPDENPDFKFSVPIDTGR
jgi:hypothetical protein